MSEMSDYFAYAENSGAVLLDASNFQLEDFRIMTFVKQSLERITQGKVELGYDSPAGSVDLKKLIAENESRGSFKFTSSNVSVNSGGVSVSFDNIFRYLARQASVHGKDEVIVTTPTYPEVPRSVNYNGLKSVFVPTDHINGFLPTAEAILAKISPRTASIFLISPGNPASCYISNTELEKIVALAQSNNTLLVFDAIFEEARLNPNYQELIWNTHYNRVVKIKGPSKDRPHMNDFRVGWSVSPDQQLISELSLASEVAGFSISCMVDEIIRTEMALRLGHPNNTVDLDLYRHELSDFFQKIDCGISLAKQVCEHHSAVNRIIVPESGNILFVSPKKEVCLEKGITNSHELFYYVLNRSGIALTPGHVFITDPNEIWFRITMTRNPEKFASHLKSAMDSLL